MEVTLISKETIKPSSPTPHHLKHWQLSLIDQCLISAADIRIVFFYLAQGDRYQFQNTNMSDQLKRSLSDVLTGFYPLAGRLNDNQSILCNDEGLEFVEARVRAPLTLSQFAASPKVEELERLLPNGKGLSAVQVTVFDACGGVSIGVNLSHVIADASSTALFVNSWASIARGDTSGTFVAPFNYSSLFPPRDVPLQMVDPDLHTQGVGKLVTKRFVFALSKINRLKAKLNYHRPTRVEALSALVFKCLIDVSKSTSSKPVFPGMAINLRTRMRAPLTNHYLGNMVLLLMMNEVGTDATLNDVGVQLSKLIKEVDGNYVQCLQADNALVLLEKLVQHTELCTNKDVRALALSSWCRFPFYEVDFGWGEPTWVAPVFPTARDSVILMDAKSDEGIGIEAWVTLEEDDMTKFESELAASQKCFT